MTMTNEQALELFNLLNSLELKPGTNLEYAATKTLRKMKAWAQAYHEKLKDIDDDNCATEKTDKGTEIRLMKTLKRTLKEGGAEEYQVPVYTADGEKKRTEAKRKFLADKVSDAYKFDIHKTSDTATLTSYQKIALADLGFCDEPEAPSLS
jgi:hypothetical protein